MVQQFQKINDVNGTLYLSGDKSISHRALLISSLAQGKSEIKNLVNSDDIKSTISSLESLGIKVENAGEKTIVSGNGYKGYKLPDKPIYTGNSGTTARLLSGILAVQNFDSLLTGDDSLSTRPMKRIIEPLVEMGAEIKSNDDGRLPLYISRSDNLKPILYQMPIASAQVKSAILLVGLHMDNETTVVESTPTRNHTENMLGLKVVHQDGRISSSVSRENYPVPNEFFIPGDISSAMFFIVLALLTKNSQLTIKDVSLNPTRIESLNVLKRMGGDVEIEERGVSNQEVYGDVLVRSSDLQNVKFEKGIIPLIIDEIPALTIAGIFADGIFELRGATELRVKESDRIRAICNNLLKLGLDVEEYKDGFNVSGNIKNSSASFNSFGDHRIAMAFAILSSHLEG
ncbi:MAG: 3-phosphoshikimate 1-carboxyvinyltransferase, partial [Ignavibacteriaceae bacterium]|nr:3-phosphoshikimate 1-carboxyvinyltransferase [Ignavibacteriaceae bacterium]